ncbi:MAG TPA: hypothetical protein VLA12_15415 [Planctomycetaceae bacterium]|nr:hypothetical protein [Planctomycetaceae bacterium]
MKRLSLLLCAVLTVNSLGCGVMQGVQNFSAQTVQMFRGTPDDPYEDFDDPNRIDEKQEQMMLDARQSLGASHEPDKWWTSLQSAEARSIERSVGVEYH